VNRPYENRPLIGRILFHLKRYIWQYREIRPLLLQVRPCKVGSPCAALGFRLHTAPCHPERCEAWSCSSRRTFGASPKSTRRSRSGISGGVPLKMTRGVKCVSSLVETNHYEINRQSVGVGALDNPKTINYCETKKRCLSALHS